MNSPSLCIGTFFVLLICSIGICLADESPMYVITIQGEKSSFVNGTDGMFEIQGMDLASDITITDENQTRTISAENLTNLSYPLIAAAVFSGSDNESTSLIEVSNLSFSEGYTNLTLQGENLQYYDGVKLKEFAQNATPLDGTTVQNATHFSVYLEFPEGIKENMLYINSEDGGFA
jgi:hypothetical protein